MPVAASSCKSSGFDLLTFVDARVDDFFQAREIEIEVVEDVVSGFDNHGHQSPAAHVLIT